MFLQMLQSLSLCSQSDNNVSPNHKNIPYFLNDRSWYLATQIVVVSFDDVYRYSSLKLHGADLTV